MGGRARVSVDDRSVECLDALVVAAADLEGRWTRFERSSEISQLNDAAGAPVVVSRETAELVQKAKLAHLATSGLFDPLMLREIERAGYSTTFDMVGSFGGVRTEDSVVALMTARPTPGEILVDPDSGLVQLPEDGAFDPGGIGKGCAADYLASLALAAGARWTVVDLGGDIRVEGDDLPFGDFRIDVGHPDGGTVCSVSMVAGAAATSGTWRRRWNAPDGRVQHHLLDPETGRPATSDLISATVLAAETWWAEAVATSVVVAGSERGRELLGEVGLPGVLIAEGGSVELVGNIEEYICE